MIRWLAILVAVACLVGAGLAVYEWRRPGPLAADTIVIVPRGASVARIGRTLEEAGVVRVAPVLVWGARLTGQALKAGEYQFAPRTSVSSAVARLAKGETLVRQLTIPEGRNRGEVAEILNQAYGLTGRIEPASLREGWLLPETYSYTYGDDRAELVARMQSDMDALLRAAWQTRQPGLPLSSPEHAVILASIVEKETALPEERSRVAGVFINRLRRGIKLEADPTVVYAATLGLEPMERPISRRDLARDSPYNTYRYPGLPPTAIANPGRASIEAVLQPLATDELYFVADGTGGHAFSKSWAEHLRHVARLRRLEASARAP